MKALIKRVIPSPVKHGLQEILRRTWMPPKSARNFLAHGGTFRVRVAGQPVTLTHTNCWIENDLFWRGLSGYEPVTMRTWLALARSAKTVVDIGANTGVFGLFARAVNPAASIHSFEPMPSFFDILRRNDALNHSQLVLHSIALSDAPGSFPMYVPRLGQGNVYSASLSLEHYYYHQKTEPDLVTVAVSTFDSIAATDKITHVDLVKIDAEGFDAQVVSGMRETINRDRPNIIVEMQNREAGEAIMATLPTGYRYFTLTDSDNAVIEVPRAGQPFGMNYLFANERFDPTTIIPPA